MVDHEYAPYPNRVGCVKCPYPKEAHCSGNAPTAEVQTSRERMTAVGVGTDTVGRSALTVDAASDPSQNAPWLPTSELQNTLEEIASNYPHGSRQKIAIRQAQSYSIANNELPNI